MHGEKISNNKSYDSFFLILFVFVNLNAQKEIIIFIHGTIGPLTSFPFSIKSIKKLFRDERTEPNIAKNAISRFYQRYLNQSRTDGMHKYQPISDLGLKQFGSGKNKKQLLKFKSLFKQSFKKVNPNKKYIFYTFGWDGRIDSYKRKKWGKILHKEITNLIQLNPKEKFEIQIYAHSHGGNVALNLAKIKKSNFKIKKLILLGTPIQKNTSKLIKSEIFEKIYNFYSKRDYIQKIEKKLLLTKKTKRKFFSKNLLLKVKQIEIKCDKIKPSHWELWFYGKSKSCFIHKLAYKYFVYKKKLPIYPYPISFFVPQIINEIENNNHLNKMQNLHLNISKKNIKNTFSIDLSPTENDNIQIEFKSN